MDSAWVALARWYCAAGKVPNLHEEHPQESSAAVPRWSG